MFCTRSIQTLSFCLILGCWSPSVLAQRQPAKVVSAELTSRETYVGQPIHFRVKVVNGKIASPPSAPEVDGLQFASPRPMRSHQMQIINGRRTASTTIIWDFEVVADRAGEFTIPAIDVVVNNRSYRTDPFKFVATKSETGDLLLVEIDDGSNGEESPRGYVGQAIKLKLKIWLRPFKDRRRNYRLNAQSMWNQISESTSWGAFQETLELASEGKAELGASEVLRRDTEGTTRAYYLYEVIATVYPKKPGKIDVDDVKIVVDYPTGLGRSPSSRFGLFGPSLLDEVMGSARKPSRPISASASSPSIRILEVPQKGRPEFYRGAVGKYRIVAEATPTKVNAGDSINLQIGLQGDGPMEFVQAPALSQLDSLTRDFKVSDDALAGFVQGDGKLFSTTLRPLREGIASIPPIPFSYFDPKTERFETTFTEPIPLEVGAANQLSLDEVVGGNPIRQMPASSDPDQSTDREATESVPFVAQNYAADRLVRTSTSGWLNWLALGLPPSVVGLLWLFREGPSTLRRLRGAPRPLQITVAAVRNAKTHSDLSEALRSRTRDNADPDSSTLSELLLRCERSAYSPAASESLDNLRMDVLRELRKYE